MFHRRVLLILIVKLLCSYHTNISICVFALVREHRGIFFAVF